jgi:hypothetical protein
MSDNEHDAAAIAAYEAYTQSVAINPISAGRYLLANREAVERGQGLVQAANELNPPPSTSPGEAESALLVKAEMDRLVEDEKNARVHLIAQYEHIKAVNPILASRFYIEHNLFYK